MRRTLLVLCLLCSLATSARAQTPAEARAAAVVDEMMKAMGGIEGWERTRYLRFDWVVEREGKTVAYVRHLWDRYHGRYRVEWESRDGQKMAALFNVNSRDGRVYVNGERARDEDEQKFLDQAYGRFINDSYWLLMPWKLKDRGVRLRYHGEEKMDGQTYDVVQVSFEGVGLTPGDNYWAFINRRTHLMDRWAYFLQDFEGKPAMEKATPWDWKDWQMIGGIRLAREKVRLGGEPARIYFPVLLAPATVSDTVFESLETSMPGPAPATK
jgi:hypothetical protein